MGGLVVLVILLAIGTVAGTVLAIQYSKELMIDESGSLSAADGSGEVSVKSHGIKLFTYTISTDSSRICITASDLALAWSENENGGTVAIVIESSEGDESSVNRLTPTNAKMTK